MEFNPESMKKILATFTEELTEQCQIITDGLLKLEKAENVAEIIETIFRSAHNIKGAARGVGVKDVGDIAHQIESMFAAIQKKTLEVTPSLIDVCLEAVDKMHISLQSYIAKTPLPFDLNAFLIRLQTGQPIANTQQSSNSPRPAVCPSDPAPQSVGSREQTSRRLAEPHTTEHESIRVAIENLDRVSALTEEIQATKIAIDEHYTDLSTLATQTKQLEYSWKEMGFALQNSLSRETEINLQQLYNYNADQFFEINQALQQLHKNMRRHINELTTLSNTLLDEVRTLRLIPASTLLGTLPRTVRDIAKELKKQVNITISGDTVKMDKMVLEGLQDPLIHLIRNAIDHGIEAPEERKKLGKPESGTININVHEQGDQILIAVHDDGAGIDLARVTNIAIAKNMITQAESESMSDAEILELIFRPGFSTKEIITTISGRGIGLDVVKANIDNLKGHVSIQTELHKGTTFNLRVPLTLASERGLLIRSGGQPFVIPINLIERVLVIHSTDIIDVEASQAILLDKHPVPLRILADILGLARKEPAKRDQLPIIIVKKGWSIVALLVEEIISEREIVIKPLQPPLTNVPCVAGGTLAGNGQVIIVLNSNDIISKALHISNISPIILSESTEEIVVTRPHILVVDDSITTRTLEKNILENKDYQVTVAVNGKEAWDLLQKQKFSLVITDVSMPIMDGFALTERVKTSESLRSTPVIIVTSLDSDAEKKRGIDVGADAYIIKNEFESDKLLSIVEQLV